LFSFIASQIVLEVYLEKLYAESVM